MPRACARELPGGLWHPHCFTIEGLQNASLTHWTSGCPTGHTSMPKRLIPENRTTGENANTGASSTSAGQVKGTASPDDPRLGDYWTKRSAAWYTLIGHQSILLAWIICMSVIASHAWWLYTIVSRSGSVFVIKDDLHALSYFSGTFRRKYPVQLIELREKIPAAGLRQLMRSPIDHL